MKTTRKQAVMIYNMAKWVNTFEICDLDRKEYIKSLMSFSIVDNLKELKKYIKEHEAEDIINVDNRYSKLINSIIDDLKQQRIDLLTANNFVRNDDVISQEKEILMTIEEVKKYETI